MNRLILKLALALLPPSRRTWGEAMMGEFDALPDGQSGFALGCLGASLRENFLTGEGWARLGFGTVLVLSGWLTLFWTQSSLKMLAAAGYNSNGKLFWLVAIQSVVLIPIICGIAAFKATKMPTNRLYLAKIGYKATCACLWASAFLQLALCVVSVAFILEATAKFEQIETSLNIGFVTGMLFLGVAYFARKGPRVMGNVSAFVAFLSFSFAGIVKISQLGQSEIVGHILVPTALGMAFLMCLTAISGALFTWMERPAQSFGQH